MDQATQVSLNPKRQTYSRLELEVDDGLSTREEGIIHDIGNEQGVTAALHLVQQSVRQQDGFRGVERLTETRSDLRATILIKQNNITAVRFSKSNAVIQ